MRVLGERKKASMLNRIFSYTKGLLSKARRKTCSSMSTEVQIIHDHFQRTLDNEEIYKEFIEDKLFSLVNELIKQGNKGQLSLDDTSHIKPHSLKLAGMASIYCSALQEYVRGYKGVWVIWSNDEVTIPLKMLPWYSKDVFKNADGYKKKTQLAQELIHKLSSKINCKYFLADGLYQSEEMMTYLDQMNYKFCLRLPQNRLISSIVNEKGVKVGKNNDFHLKRNTKTMTKVGFLKGKKYFITTHKRKNCKTQEYQHVFLISNFKLEKPIEMVKFYRKRWIIEKFFRTAKQNLGLDHCQARTMEKQMMHLTLVSFAYTVLDLTKSRKKLKSPEEAQRLLWELKSDLKGGLISLVREVFHVLA